MQRLYLCTLILALDCLAHTACGQDAPTPNQYPPMLVLETGGHTAMCNWLEFSPDGKRLISVGDDKVIRVWNVQNPTHPFLDRSIRVPIGFGPWGKLYAGAISPDGRWLAVAGYDWSNAIRILELKSGRCAGLLTGHSNVIHSLAFSPDGRWIVSGSSDSLAGLWDVSGLSQLRDADDTLEEISGIGLEGHTGSVYRVCVIPGRDSMRVVSVADDGTGRIWESNDAGIWSTVKLLDHFEDEVTRLAASPDGRWFATSCEGGSVQQWNSDGELVREWTLDESRGPYVRSVAFTPDSRWLIMADSGEHEGCQVVSTTGSQVLCRFDGHDNTVMHATCRPFADQSGQLLVASAGGDSNEILLWDARTGNLVSQIAGSGRGKYAAAFSRDGQSIAWGSINRGSSLDADHALQAAFDLSSLELAGPVADEGDWLRGSLSSADTEGIVYEEEPQVLVVKRGKRQICRIELQQDDDEVICFAFVPGRPLVVVGSSFQFTLHDARTGEKLREFVGHDGMVNAIGISPDGRRVLSASDDQTLRLWSLENLQTRNPVVGMAFFLNDAGNVGLSEVMSGFPAEAAGFQVGDVLLKADGVNLNSMEQVIELVKGSPVDRSITFLVQRGDERLRLSVAPRLGIVPDKAPPLISFLFAENQDDWVAWTPEGYYAASPNGDRLIGWHINKDMVQQPGFLYGWQLRRKMYRPDVIESVLATGSTTQAFAQLSEERHERLEPVLDIRNDEALQAAPVIRIDAPASGDRTQEESIQLKGQVTVENARIQSVRITVNGRPVTTSRNIVRSDVESETEAESDVRVIDQTIPLVRGRNLIEVVASTEFVTSQPLQVEVFSEPAGASATAIRPSLYLLTIGVSDYADDSLSLSFADKDAHGLAEAFKLQEGRFFQKVVSRTLVNADVTEREVRRGLKWLRESATQHDLAVVLVSGHGWCDAQGSYFFVPHDFDVKEPQITGIRWTEIMEPLKDLPAKVLLLMDTCHSAGVLGAAGGQTKSLNNSLEAALREMTSIEAGLVVMTSSTGKEASLEHADWGHGAFTLSVIEALTSQRKVPASQTPLPADTNNDGIVEVVELDTYVTQRVKELTGGAQHPVTRRGDIPSFPLGAITVRQ